MYIDSLCHSVFFIQYFSCKCLHAVTAVLLYKKTCINHNLSISCSVQGHYTVT